MEGWISLYRKFINWEWYQDNNTKSVFLHLLLTANHEEKKWQGITVKRGQLITSVAHLSENLGISIQSVRTSLNRLKSTNEITIKSTNKNSLVTIENYDLYQSSDTKLTNKLTNNLTNKQQTANKQLTTNNNYNNYNNIININNNNIIKAYEEEIGFITPFQYEKLMTYNEDLSEEMIIEAIHRASRMNKKSLAYIEGILKQWIKSGYKVVADIQDTAKHKQTEETNKERLQRLLGVNNG